MQNPDQTYHRLFSYPILVEQLVRGFVPEAMASDLEFSRMERVNAKGFAEALDGEIHRREGDVIWRLPTRDGLDVFLYLMLEFQSTVDTFMAVRTQIYQGLLWDQIIKERNLRRGDKLPPVLMVVLHSGETRWHAATDTASLVALPPDSPLWPWQPQIRYHLLDIGALPFGPLADRDNLALLLFQLEQQHHLPDALPALLRAVGEWFGRHGDHEELGSLFTELVRQAMAGYGISVSATDSLMEITTMVETLVESWQRNWFAQGEIKGEIKGGIKGESKALIRMLEKRFDPLTPALRGRIEAADAAAIEDWLDRLLDASSLDTLFGSQSKPDA